VSHASAIARAAGITLGLLAAVIGAVPGDALGAEEPLRTQVRRLYGFEAAGDAADLRKLADSVQVDVVQDNGVTEGSNCARITIPRGTGYGVFHLGPAACKGWGDFDYFAIDVYCDDEESRPLVLELWDAASKNYATRCTFEDVRVRRGRQTLLYRIDRCKRNGKEGREWEELEPQDKIRMNELVRVKLFATPPKDRDLVLWIDNLRLMQADAAKPKLRVPLPERAVAFDFGSPGAVVPGFKNVSAGTKFGPGQEWGFVSPDGAAHAGEGWPDLLTGTFVTGPQDRPLEFRARVKPGSYDVWLAAGPILRPDLRSPRFLLKANDRVLLDESPSPAEFASEKWLYRFLRTQYSERPHAVWLDFVDRMYPVRTVRVDATDGLFRLESQGHFLSAVVLVPADGSGTFDDFVSSVRDVRIAAFEQSLLARTAKKPEPQPGDGPFVLFVPDDRTATGPSTGPHANERKRTALETSVARNGQVVLRVAVTPFEDLGKCVVETGPLQGSDATIPAAAVRGYFQNFRWRSEGVGESALLPGTEATIEKGVTATFWFRLRVPTGTPPGTYRGTFAFRTERHGRREIPVSLVVHPVTLRSELPVSYGMYWSPPQRPGFPPEHERKVHAEQLAWMRDLGFTACAVGGPTVLGLKGKDQVSLRFDPRPFELAREAGMGRRPEQMLMANQLGLARAIGRRLPGSLGAKVDQNPGIELRQPEFRSYYRNALRQYAEFLKSIGMPTAIEVVDEPRETPNPWNRNLADTLAYADMLHEVPGLKTFVTPMSDGNSGKDYTVLAEHVDVVSIHAWPPSRGLLERTRRAGRTLWLYNTGMDRFSWGFYAWRAGAVGRWEWHFCFPEDTAVGGYPGREWYNPFTGSHGLAPHAPDAEHQGGMLFQSAFLRTAAGIEDYAWLHTLEETLRERAKDGRHPETVRAARAFLDALRRTIPELPGAKGLATAEDGALVGTGIDDDATRHLDAWRDRLAGFLVELAR
jgi:hypothetical protein